MNNSGREFPKRSEPAFVACPSDATVPELLNIV